MKKLFIVLLSCLVINTVQAGTKFSTSSALTGAVVGGAVGYAVGSSNSTPKFTPQQSLPAISGKYSTISCISLDGALCYGGSLNTTIPRYVKKMGFSKYNKFYTTPCITHEGACAYFRGEYPRFIITIEVE